MAMACPLVLASASALPLSLAASILLPSVTSSNMQLSTEVGALACGAAMDMDGLTVRVVKVRKVAQVNEMIDLCMIQLLLPEQRPGPQLPVW